MESATFRDWLAEHGCRFDAPGVEHRGEGPASVTVHREGRSAQLPNVGSKKPIDFDTAKAVCAALALDWRELPGPKGRA